jgi:hypothetical protein
VPGFPSRRGSAWRQRSLLGVVHRALVSLAVGVPSLLLALSTRLAQRVPQRYLRLKPGPSRQHSQSGQAPFSAPRLTCWLCTVLLRGTSCWAILRGYFQYYHLKITVFTSLSTQCHLTYVTCQWLNVCRRLTHWYAPAHILNYCFYLKKFFWHEVKEEVVGFQIVYMLSHFNFLTVFIITYKSLTKFFAVPFGVLHYS